MGHKKVLYASTVLSAGSMSSTSTIHSSATNTDNLDNIGYQVTWTGTPTGTISVECAMTATGTYQALTFNPALSQPAGSSGGYLISINQTPFPWIRVSYTNASGSGSLTVTISAKDLN